MLKRSILLAVTLAASVHVSAAGASDVNAGPDADSASSGASALFQSFKAALTSASEKLCRGNGKRRCPPEETPPPPEDTTPPPPDDPAPPPPDEPTPPPPDTSTPPPDGNGAVLRSAVGTNLEAITYWSPQIPFVNVMKSSSGWISGDGSAWDNGKALDLDANGWVRSLAPGQVARKLMLREFGDRYPAGQYVVRYQGEGVIRFNFAARTVSEAPGEIVIQVTPSTDGVLMNIEQTNPANYVRNIAITMPGGICQGQPFTHVPTAASCSADRPYLSFADHHASLLFNPMFADRLRGYSVLRFMDWMQTNNSSVKTWLQRTPVSYSTWATTNGAPPEVMIALANLTGAHPWFNIPHQADDAYVSSLAQLVKSTLDPALKVYVEHSNEVWNSMFQQTGYAAQRGGAQGLDGFQYHGQRSRAIGQVFKAALGNARVVAVLGAQAANPWTARQALEYLRSSGALGIDAVAIAPYFGGAIDTDSAPQYTAMTMDELFALARSTMLPQAQAYTAGYRNLVAEFNVRLIAYEGGQHLVGYLGAENNDALSQRLDAFNRDPRMKQLYLDYLQGWKHEGGELFVHFNDVGRYTKWGRWGALEYVAQPRSSAPKFDGVHTFIEQTPVWWGQ